MSRNQIVANIAQALASKSGVNIIYRKESGILETRTFYPSAIKATKGSRADRRTYVDGFCPHRQAPRRFTLDKVVHADFGVGR